MFSCLPQGLELQKSHLMANNCRNITIIYFRRLVLYIVLLLKTENATCIALCVYVQHNRPKHFMEYGIPSDKRHYIKDKRVKGKGGSHERPTNVLVLLDPFPYYSPVA